MDEQFLALYPARPLVASCDECGSRNDLIKSAGGEDVLLCRPCDDEIYGDN